MGGLHFPVTKSFLWLLINVLVIFAQSATKFCTEHSRIHKQGVCGTSIPKVLSALCGKTGYVEKMYKRAESSPIDNIADMDAKTFLMLSEQSPELTRSLLGLLQTKRDASMFLNKRGDYYRAGIACECCYHRCTVRELAMYCKDGEKILKQLGSKLMF